MLFLLVFSCPHFAKQLETVNDWLAPIVDLKQLVSIDASSNCAYTSQEIELWYRALFNRLESVHPKLRKFFFTVGDSCVWVLREDLDVWERRSIPLFQYWDMVTGVYDDI
jgi:hypothetical protein